MADFEALLNESLELETPREGTVVKGKVKAVEAGQAIIENGYKIDYELTKIMVALSQLFYFNLL